MPRPAAPGAALDLLARNVEAGATVVAIGPLTNLALLETARPGTLAAADVVAMGGWVQPAPAGLPPWGPDTDWNIQFDRPAAEIVAGSAPLTLVTLPATLTAWLRASDLPRLRAAGPLGRLLAAQSEAHGDESGLTAIGRAHPGLPDDLLNFHYDPVTVAVAVGWEGATFEKRPVYFGPGERLFRVVTAVDGDAFAERWLSLIGEV